MHANVSGYRGQVAFGRISHTASMSCRVHNSAGKLSQRTDSSCIVFRKHCSSCCTASGTKMKKSSNKFRGRPEITEVKKHVSILHGIILNIAVIDMR